MHTTELKLKTVTPMFLHGHNNMIVELRPPPFKALFRYWWRTVQDCSWKSLREKEAKLFGSTDGKAPFSIRIPEKTNHLGKPIEYSPLPHKNTFRTKAYNVDKKFDLQLITKSTLDVLKYEQIAKLGFLLGGVGNRSRRGFGSIRETCWNFTDICSLQKEVLETLNAVAKDERFQIDGTVIESIKSTRYRPIIRCIFFGQLNSDFKSLLQNIGKATHKHNSRGSQALGHAWRAERLASPVHVRVQKIGNDYLPIVTQLNWNEPSENDLKKQQEFIDAII